MNWMKLNWLMGLALIIAMTSCTDDGDDGPTVTDGILSIDASNLPDNGDNFEYVVWMNSGGVNFRIGNFSVDNGLPSQTQWTIGDLNSLQNAESVIISMNVVGITPTTPDNMTMMEAEFGTVDANSGSFTTAPMISDAKTFEASTATYFLATPTTSTMSEEFAGIWFGNNSTGSVTPGLDLPALSDGWVYQGWVEAETGLNLRTGKFYNPTAADLESIYNGPLNGYDVPGEDFNQNLPMMGNPPDLRNKYVWLTVQPDTFSDMMFPLPVFQDTIGHDAGQTYVLPNSFPSFAGTASRK